MASQAALVIHSFAAAISSILNSLIFAG